MVTYMMVSSSGVLVPLSPSRQGPSPPCSAEICVVSLTEERSHTPGLRPLDGGLFQKGNSISSQTRSFILEDSVTLTEKTHGISSRQPSISWLKCLVGLSNSLLMSKVKSIYLSIYLSILTFSSVQSSRSVVSDSLQPPGLQHARPPCPSPTPKVHSNSCASSQ